MENAEGIAIIVEGRKDEAALKQFGLDGEIILAKSSGKSFQDILSEIEEREKEEIILLMDFDRRGREWTSRLAKNLNSMRIKPNLTYWKKLSGLVGRDVKDIEGLSAYVLTLCRKLGKNISSE